ncbi:MAG TPA: LysM peptidoglycan-binding domain-containing protein [Gemmatimonadota bacterium]|nr:LysM peptidoglycan-binding domain-containing protein [Gemmatimonadota bacterium]
MAAQGTRHTVRKGDTLWGLAEEYLGAGRRWPEIYEYNNSEDVVAETGTRIVDPNFILVGQTIVIPGPAQATANRAAQGTGTTASSGTGATSSSGPGATSSSGSGTTSPSPPAQGPGGRQLAPERDGRWPAFDEIYWPAFRFSLPSTPIRILLGAPPTHMAEIKLSGSITIQSKRTIDFLTFTKDSMEISARNEAATALQRLIADSSVKFNPSKGEVTFENGITLHANTPYAPRAKVSMGISMTTGLPVAKASIKAAPIKGRINHFVYLTEKFGIDIEITQLPRQPGTRLQPQPVPQPQSYPLPYPRPGPSPYSQPLGSPQPYPGPGAQPYPGPGAQPYPGPGAQPYPGPGPQPYPRREPQPTEPTNWEVLVGSALLGAALAVVVVTIVEDIATLGAGIADDPASGMLAAGMAARGWTMVRYAPAVVGGTQTVSGWAMRAAPHLQRAWQAVQSAGAQMVSIMVQGAGPVAATVPAR